MRPRTVVGAHDAGTAILGLQPPLAQRRAPVGADVLQAANRAAGGVAEQHHAAAEDVHALGFAGDQVLRQGGDVPAGRRQAGGVIGRISIDMVAKMARVNTTQPPYRLHASHIRAATYLRGADRRAVL